MGLLDVPPFVHEYKPSSITYGRGCIAEIGGELDGQGLSNALVVTGQTVGATTAVMDPVREGIGDRLAGIWNGTMPTKAIETAYDGIEFIAETDADALVAVGGGSSLDTATTMSVLDASDRSLDEVRAEFRETGAIAVPDDPDSLVPVFAVPTTFAGADLSVAAGTTLPTDDGDGRREFVFVNDDLMPAGLFSDPALFETTPMDALAGSAINGFDKAIEKVYSAFANPVTDATAVRGLQYLCSSLPELRESDDPAVVDRAVVGGILAQYGVSVPGAYKINVVHALGHALRATFGVQQGVAHAVVLPHALQFMFERVDGRRDVLAEGLRVEKTDETAAAIIDAVVEIRDSLRLPSHLRDVDGATKDGLRDAAELTHEDPFFNAGPPNFDPSVDAVEGILERAW